MRERADERQRVHTERDGLQDQRVAQRSGRGKRGLGDLDDRLVNGHQLLADEDPLDPAPAHASGSPHGPQRSHEPVDRAVVTVPAYFDDSQRQACAEHMLERLRERFSDQAVRDTFWQLPQVRALVGA